MGKITKILRPLNINFEKSDAIKTGRFLLFFLFVYMVLSIGIKTLFPIQLIEAWIAGNVLGMLSLFGHTGSITVGETALIELALGPAIEISELCTGLMETLIIVGAIISSIGIGWNKRISGAIAAAIISILLNHARIVFTALLIFGTNDLELIEFTHNFLFKIFLFVSIAGMYIIWFYWAVASEVKEKR